MKYWFHAEEAVKTWPGRCKWWAYDRTDGAVFKHGPIAFLPSPPPYLFCLRGKPAPDDYRWLPAKEAIKEWGGKGGSKGWWLYDPLTEDVSTASVCSNMWVDRCRFIPRGKPPFPVQIAPAELGMITLDKHRQSLEWLKGNICDSINMLLEDDHEKIR